MDQESQTSAVANVQGLRLGEPHKAALRIHELLDGVNALMIASIKPGITAAELSHNQEKKYAENDRKSIYCRNSPRLRDNPRLFYALYSPQGFNGDGKAGD